jgi:hypothetical protein
MRRDHIRSGRLMSLVGPLIRGAAHKFLKRSGAHRTPSERYRTVATDPKPSSSPRAANLALAIACVSAPALKSEPYDRMA